MKRRFCIAITLAVLLLSIEACDDNRRAKNFNEKTKVDANGVDFINNGIASGRAEIMLSQLAEKRSKNPKIISFAKMMITDHTALGNELNNLAADQLVTPIVQKDTLDTEHNKIISGLSKKTGAEFDKEYMQVMVADHEKAVGLFKSASTNQDNEVKNMANKLLPKLQSHLKEANALYSSLK